MKSDIKNLEFSKTFLRMQAAFAAANFIRGEEGLCINCTSFATMNGGKNVPGNTKYSLDQNVSKNGTKSVCSRV